MIPAAAEDVCRIKVDQIIEKWGRGVSNRRLEGWDIPDVPAEVGFRADATHLTLFFYSCIFDHVSAC